jgi:transposase
MKDEILKLRKEGLSYDEIINKLGCSKSTISYHCKKNNLGQNKEKLNQEKINDLNEYYKTHTVIETAEYFKLGTATITKYVDKKRIILSSDERKDKNIERVKKRRRVLKEMAVEYKGGCCQQCGYNKCLDSLHFHHLNPNEKDFGISQNGVTRSWEKIKEELDKCILVCGNCHGEIHAGFIILK